MNWMGMVAPLFANVEYDLSTLIPFASNIWDLIFVGDGCCFAGTGVGLLKCVEWKR